MNGCGCVGPDNHPGSLMNYKGDVAAIRQHGFDGVKFGAPHSQHCCRILTLKRFAGGGCGCRRLWEEREHDAVCGAAPGECRPEPRIRRGPHRELPLSVSSAFVQSSVVRLRIGAWQGVCARTPRWAQRVHRRRTRCGPTRVSRRRDCARSRTPHRAGLYGRDLPRPDSEDGASLPPAGQQQAQLLGKA